VYYDTSKFKNYTKLSRQNLEALKEGARVEKNDGKKNATDFALWKFSPVGEKRQMEWNSPWGVGFPGWHIECSAMSLKYLGDNFDIHCGGVDHIGVHHTNEIAQSEAATGKSPWVNYWLHNEFLNIAGGKKMAKSDDNFLTLENALIKKGINPLAYRFATLGTHYRKAMEYSEAAVANAQSGLEHLYNQVRKLGKSRGKINKKYQEKFLQAINDDLNTSPALAVAQEVLKSGLSAEEKLATVLDFDEVLGLDLASALEKEKILPEIKKIIKAREKARDEKNWPESDRLRLEIEKLGYIVEDTKDGQRVYKK
ncbi:MAG: cysteine--tRNA ligase, partial [bacterium]